jgi:heme exporter protein B
MTPVSSTASTASASEARAARPRFAGLASIVTIAGKDLRAELRSKETINAALSFALVIIVLFSFAFDPGSEQLHEMSGGLLWLVFTFAGALILNRSFARELTNDCLDALISSPVSPAQLWAGKSLANYVLLLAVEAICLPIFGIFYNVHWTGQLGWLVLVVLLATWAITVIGTIFSAMTVNLRLRELMLPTLLYPMIIPALMGAIHLTTILVGGDPPGKDDLIWFRVLVAFDIIFTLLAVTLVDTLLVG